MSAAPQFSVVIPVFNRAGVVEETLDSVAAQTYRPIEIVVVDDGSADDSCDVVRRWLQRNEQPGLSLRLLKQPNSGAAAARNRGMAEASGEFVQFLDSDDLLLPQHLTRCAAAMDEEDSEVAISGYEVFHSRTGKAVNRFARSRQSSPLDSMVAMTLFAVPLCVAFRDSLLKRLGPWRTDMQVCEDREFIERALLEATKAVVVEDISARLRRGATDHLSDVAGRETWYRNQVICDHAVLKGACPRPEVSDGARASFASYLYHQALLARAAALAATCEEYIHLAESMDVRLGPGGRIRQGLSHAGAIGSALYKAAWVADKIILTPVLSVLQR